MRITNSSVSMASTRTYQAEAQQTVTHLDRGQGAFAGSTRLTVSTMQTKSLEVEGGMVHYVSSNPEAVTEEAPSIKQTDTKTVNTPAQNSGIPILNAGNWFNEIKASAENDPKVQILRKMVELLERITGKKFSRGLTDKPAGQPSKNGSGFIAASASYRRTAAMLGQLELSIANRRTGSTPELDAAPYFSNDAQQINGYWIRQTTESGFIKGEEHTSYASVGTAVTADGRTIDFGITLEMSRSFEAAYKVVGKEEIFTDPLVINLDTDAAALSDVTFCFDLDTDGTEEEISTLDWGSGFLALDKNGDGKINDGSELFGAKTGDGFGELAQYDQDGNGWIDEGDEVFSQLRIWTKCGSEDAELLSLKEAGVGAIFLGSQGTEFTLADPAGNENAVIRRTGLYLKESGQAGTVQHVDFKA